MDSTGAFLHSRTLTFPADDPSITLSIYSHVIPSDRGRLALLWDDDRKAKVVEMFPHVPKKAAK